MSASVVHWVRYLAPGQTGPGEVAYYFSGPRRSLDDVRKEHPDKFERPGFYSLAVSTGETMAVAA